MRYWFRIQRPDVEVYLTTFRKFYDRHTYLVNKFDTSVSPMLKGLFTNCDI